MRGMRFRTWLPEISESNGVVTSSVLFHMFAEENLRCCGIDILELWKTTIILFEFFQMCLSCEMNTQDQAVNRKSDQIRMAVVMFKWFFFVLLYQSIIRIENNFFSVNRYCKYWNAVIGWRLWLNGCDIVLFEIN